MWIRYDNVIYKPNKISISHYFHDCVGKYYYNIDLNGAELGKFSKERAVEIINEITEAIAKGDRIYFLKSEN